MIPLEPKLPTVLIGGLVPLGADGTMSGIAKHATAGPWRITPLGLEGDAQGDRNQHGGPEKALHHYPRDHYAAWLAEDGFHPLLQMPGAFGENISTFGWTEANVCIGDVLRFGLALLQVSQGRQPCFRLNRRFGRSDMAVKVQRTGRTGWYFRVLEPAIVQNGERFILVDRPQPQWPVSRLIHLLYADTGNLAAMRDAALISELAEGWRVLFNRRLEMGATEDWQKRLTGLLV